MTPSPSARALLPALVLLSLLAAPATPALAAADSASVASAPAPALPLLLDPTDTGYGVSVVFTRIPNAADVNDLSYFENVQHVVLSLPAWPAGAAELTPLAQLPLPADADLVVILPGYPETHAAAGAWNFIHRRLRMVMLVDGPPADRSMILEMNAMRGLTNVIVSMPVPSRSGFERLQRPLSFRVVRP